MALGANSLSMQSVARFTRFMVIRGVLKIGRFISEATVSIAFVGL
jgi:hypothetical protein